MTQARGLLLAALEYGGYPNFAPLYQRLGLTVRIERSVRKALAAIREALPAAIEQAPAADPPGRGGRKGAISTIIRIETPDPEPPRPMPKTASDQRRFTRIPFAATVRLRDPAGTLECDLMVVSLRGMLTSSPAVWSGAIGQPVALEIRLENSDVIIRADAAVSHLEPERMGLAIRHIDVESAAHLRRLIELNLGDEGRLHRELAAMIAPS